MPPPRRGQQAAATRTFVDRQAPQKVFEDAALAIPADHSIVRVFYGVGGQGKTALCRELMRRTEPATEPTFSFLRRAELDLHGRAKDDPDKLLVWIRNGFAAAGIAFPCFDLAFAIAWEASRGEEPLPNFTRPWLSRTTAVGQIGVDEVTSAITGWVNGETIAAVTGDLMGSIPGIGFMLKRVGHWSMEKGKRFYLEKTKEALQELYDGGELKKPYALSQQLPWMLAQDLNAHLADHPDERFVLFVDEYERVFAEGGAGSQWQQNPFDSHMRSLLAETNGLLAVFFSRERLPWESDPDWRADLDGHQHLLGGLADSDADRFLAAVPIDNAAIRTAIIAGARETSVPDAPVYPLMLDLQVENWSSLSQAGVPLTPGLFNLQAESFEARRLEIVRRVLRDYGAPLELTLERLSVARRFDRPAFEHLVRNFGTGLPLDQFDRIAALSFVTRAPDGFLSIHNPVAETIRQSLTPERRDGSIAALFAHYMGRAEAATPKDVTRDSLLAFVEAAFLRRMQGMPGYVDWLEAAQERALQSTHAADLQGLWREAAEQAAALLGPEHADVAASLGNLGLLVKNSGDLSAARRLFERALAIQENTLGPNDADTAAGLNNLATLLHESGNLAAALPLHRRALAIFETTRGPQHVDTARSLNNLAGLLQSMGDYHAALPLYRRALEIRETLLGPDHPSLAMGLNNLGSIFQAIGDTPAARPLYERAREIQERVLGPDHPDLAMSLNNLAMLLQASDAAAARPLLERAIAIQQKSLGVDHPKTATGLNNLAQLLMQQGDVAEAEPLFRRALAIQQQALRGDHPETGATLFNLATLLATQGEANAAARLYGEALAIWQRALGADHPWTKAAAGMVEE